MKRAVVLSRIAGWAAVALIAVLSLVPGEVRPHTMPSSQLEHVLAYMVTAAALTFGYFRFPSVAMIATLLPIYAALLEIVQMWVPGRMSRLIDVAAGAAGSWIGIGLILLLHWLAAIPTAPSLEPRHRPQDAE